MKNNKSFELNYLKFYLIWLEHILELFSNISYPIGPFLEHCDIKDR